jgi:hypothetical protein
MSERTILRKLGADTHINETSTCRDQGKSWIQQDRVGSVAYKKSET